MAKKPFQCCDFDFRVSIETRAKHPAGNGNTANVRQKQRSRKPSN